MESADPIETICPVPPRRALYVRPRITYTNLLTQAVNRLQSIGLHRIIVLLLMHIFRWFIRLKVVVPLQVQPKGRAAAQGVMAGDRIVAICGVSTHNKTHAEIKSEMLRAGNDLDITVLR